MSLEPPRPAPAPELILGGPPAVGSLLDLEDGAADDAAPRAAPGDGGPRSHRPPRRLRTKATIAAALVVVVAAATGAFVLLGRGHGDHRQQSRGLPARAPDATVAWSFPIGSSSMEAVVAVPRGARPIVVAIPPDVRVDLAGQSEQLAGDLGAVGPRMIEAAQSLLGRRVQHVVVSDGASLASAIDGLRGIRAEVEARFSSEGRTYRTGLRHLDGNAVIAYLAAAPTLQDQFLRWQDVLQGFFAASLRLRAAPGIADDGSRVAVAMRAAHGADVKSLPTAQGVDGGVRVDSKQLAAVVEGRIRTAGGPLVRVVVLNGSGQPGVADSLALRLAPFGLQVVAAENDSHPDAFTEVLAAADSFLPYAQRVVSVIRTGSVYVDAQPTGLADVTIVVGKDLSIG